MFAANSLKSANEQRIWRTPKTFVDCVPNSALLLSWMLRKEKMSDTFNLKFVKALILNFLLSYSSNFKSDTSATIESV
jgi:hypothetical protein